MNPVNTHYILKRWHAPIKDTSGNVVLKNTSESIIFRATEYECQRQLRKLNLENDRQKTGIWYEVRKIK